MSTSPQQNRFKGVGKASIQSLHDDSERLRIGSPQIIRTMTTKSILSCITSTSFLCSTAGSSRLETPVMRHVSLSTAVSRKTAVFFPGTRWSHVLTCADDPLADPLPSAVSLAGILLEPLPYLASSSTSCHMQTLLQLGGLEKSREHRRITKEGICTCFCLSQTVFMG